MANIDIGNPGGSAPALTEALNPLITAITLSGSSVVTGSELVSNTDFSAGATGTCAHFADNGGGGTKVTIGAGSDPSGATGIVTIGGTTNYNGSWNVSNIVAGVSFDIDVTFVADDAAGTYAQITDWYLDTGNTWTTGVVTSVYDGANLYPDMLISFEAVTGQTYLLEVNQSITGDLRSVYLDNNNYYFVFPDGDFKIAFVSTFTGSETLWLDFDHYNTGAVSTTSLVSVTAIDPPLPALTIYDYADNQVATLGSDSINFAIGSNAGAGNTGSYVTATGYFAASQNTGNEVTATGHFAASQNTGSYVTATGNFSAYQNTGAEVTATGYQAASQNTSSNVTATGYFAASQNTGSYVTVTGYHAAYQNTYSNVVVLGANASATADNSAQIGDSNVTHLTVGTKAIGLPKHALIAGDVAGDIAVAGIKVGDRLDEVIEYVYVAAVTTDMLDLTSEFTIPPTPTGTISAFANNGVGGTTVTIAAGIDPAAGNVTISGTTNYNGAHDAGAIVPGVSFDIDVVFVANDAAGAYVGVPVNDIINNAGGSNTSGNKLMVRWTKLTA
jgi:hypothetical protein